MKLLLNVLLLLCVRSSGSVSSESLVVTQSPDVCFQEGETGNMSCCWDGAAERVAVKWLKNQTLMENKTVINQSTGSKNEQKSESSNLTIENMTQTHSGKYICQVTVEIPVLNGFEGQGRTVTVTPRENITNTAEGVSSDALVVIQSPDFSVQEGDTGKITCCWKGTAERVGIKWLKKQTLIENKTVISQSTGSQNEQKNKCSVFTIENMIKGDSGSYVCKVTVEIPVLAEVGGNGTTITVTARENQPDSRDHQPDSRDHQPDSRDHQPDSTDHQPDSTDHQPDSTDHQPDSTDHQPDSTDHQPDSTTRDLNEPIHITFILRCLPILLLITAFVCVQCFVHNAQKNPPAAPGNKSTSTQSREEERGDDGGTEREEENEETMC